MRNLQLRPRGVASGQQPYARIAAALVVIPLLGMITAVSAEAQLLRTLHRFTGAADGNGVVDGLSSLGGLVMDAAGNLYGTTQNGGQFNSGTVFKLDWLGNNYAVLYAFNGPAGDGKFPYAGLVMDTAGYLYGTTGNGGAADKGTVFKLDTTGNNYSVLYSFTGRPDGGGPVSALLLDGAGNIYGTTEGGGTTDGGSVFKLNAAGAEVLRADGSPFYSFIRSLTSSDAAVPLAGLITDTAGRFYGTASLGGADFSGAVFKLDPAGNEVYTNANTKSPWYSFTGHSNEFSGTNPNDGAYPRASLIIDAAGSVYGTTQLGGPSGFGTVFKVDAGGHETVLYEFKGAPTDGQLPYGNLVSDKAGDLYGTTAVGGVYTFAAGTVFKLVKLDSSYNESLLCSFIGGPDPNVFPEAGLIMDPAGNLYGTTAGNASTSYGSVFKLIPAPIPATQISVTTSGWAHSRVNASFPWILTVEITNDSANAINGPFEISFTGLPANVTVGNATGVNGCDGSPYVTAAFSVLQPGQTGIVSNIAFSSEASFTPQVYSEAFK